MATNLAINLSEDNMLAQVTGPDDLKNYFHMDPLGDLLLLDNKMLPIPLSAPRPVTAYQKIPPHTFWNNRQTRQCTTNTTSPPPKHLHSTSLPDHHASSPFHVTSPIPLEDIRSIRKDLADDPNIPKDVLLRAMTDLSQFQVSVNEHKAKLEQDFTARFETAQKAMLQEMQKHMDAFDNFREQALQENKSLRAELNSQRSTTNDLIDQNNAVRQDLASENAALLDKVKTLECELSNLSHLQGRSNEQLEAINVARRLTDRSPSAYSQPIPSSQPWCPAGFDNTAMFQPLLESLDRSINLQTANAKDHYISSAKVYDGINPEEFGPWLDEVSRLSNITHKTDIEIALCTSKGDLHQEINEMVECNYGWNTMKSKLRAKYSDYGTPDMAIHKLSTFKQGSDKMHRYIFKFGRLVEHAHNIKAHDPTSKILSPTFIAGITNSHIRHKLRWGSSGKTLKEVYADALYQDQLQTLRSVDFPETAPVSHVDINAIDRDTCKKCLKAGHWARNCTATVKGNDHDFDTQHGQSSDSQLSADIRALIKTLSNIYSQGKFFPNMSHTQNAQNTPNTPSHKRHGQFPQNNHRNNHENTNRGSNAFSNNRTSLTYNRPNPRNRTGGHRNFRSSNHTMVHEMSQGEEPLEECDCNECAETPDEEGPLGSPESPSSEDPKN